MLALLPVMFRTFLLDFWTLINAKLSFTLYILRTNEQNFTKFIYLRNKETQQTP